MKNIFAQRKDFVEGCKRNTFDLSFQNNLTMKFGRLYPVFCKEVIPGDSFRIKPTFGLRFMPLVFPIQTRMQANLHFFYVRNRTLWKDWMDFIGRTKDGLVPPYLSAQMAQELCKTGALGDYFGCPTTLVGDYGGVLRQPHQDLLYQVNPGADASYANWYLGATADTMGPVLSTVKGWNENEDTTNNKLRGFISQPFDAAKIPEINGHRYIHVKYRDRFYKNSGILLDRNLLMPVNYEGSETWRILGRHANGYTGYKTPADVFVEQGDSIPVQMVLNNDWGDEVGFITIDEVLSSTSTYRVCNATLHLDLNDVLFYCAENYGEEISYDTWSKSIPNMVDDLVDHFGNSMVRLSLSSLDSQAGFTDHQVGYFSPNFRGFYELTMSYDVAQSRDISGVDPSLNPYATGDIKVSALPFRAYEAIYNAYYRNQLNDPFKINGTPEYNKYITNDAGGSDPTVYDFFNRNWELDYLTSATQSPQQGDITPLVGVSASGDFTFQNANGTTTVVHPTLGDDGTTLTGIAAYEGETPADGSLPAGVRRLAQLIPYGISINDFRNVNALQRWLETNLRRGYKYRDQIKSHFDVDVEYKELDMPEFIGGLSEPVMVNQINQSVDQTESGYGDFGKVLGSYAGQASILASSEHDIEHYCDEHGFIIGILSVSPVPNYSQLLPKHLIKDNVLDYYFPEFGHIGNQPITYREVCPLQSFAAEDSLDDVFGYQRAWYDYIASTDEVHGEMRLSLRNFLINRVFNSRPELGAEFLQVDDDQVNDVFSVTDDTDKIIGQVYFDVTAQRPIPKFGIPRLE